MLTEPNLEATGGVAINRLWHLNFYQHCTFNGSACYRDFVMHTLEGICSLLH